MVYSFAGDDPLACRDHVRHLLGLGSWRDRRDDMPAPRPWAKPARADDEAGRIAKALALWDQALDPRGTPVEAHVRGRSLELDAIVAGHMIRYHPRLFIPKNLRTAPEHAEPGPGMVCQMRDLRTDAPCGIHRTFLTADGQKRIRERAMLGRAAGAAVQLDPGDGVTYGLGIAEGVETAMAARSRFRPLWAIGSAGGIRTLQPIPGIECLSIFADADGTGQAAAHECARRWTGAGVEVVINQAPARSPRARPRTV